MDRCLVLSLLVLALSAPLSCWRLPEEAPPPRWRRPEETSPPRWRRPEDAPLPHWRRPATPEPTQHARVKSQVPSDVANVQERVATKQINSNHDQPPIDSLPAEDVTPPLSTVTEHGSSSQEVAYEDRPPAPVVAKELPTSKFINSSRDIKPSSIREPFPKTKHLVELLPIKTATKEGKLAFIVTKPHKSKKKTKKRPKIEGVILKSDVTKVSGTLDSVESSVSTDSSPSAESSDSSLESLRRDHHDLVDNDKFDSSFKEEIDFDDATVRSKLNDIISNYGRSGAVKFRTSQHNANPGDELGPELHVHYIIHKKPLNAQEKPIPSDNNSTSLIQKRRKTPQSYERRGNGDGALHLKRKHVIYQVYDEKGNPLDKKHSHIKYHDHREGSHVHKANINTQKSYVSKIDNTFSSEGEINSERTVNDNVIIQESLFLDPESDEALVSFEDSATDEYYSSYSQSVSSDESVSEDDSLEFLDNSYQEAELPIEAGAMSTSYIGLESMSSSESLENNDDLDTYSESTILSENCGDAHNMMNIVPLESDTSEIEQESEQWDGEEQLDAAHVEDTIKLNTQTLNTPCEGCDKHNTYTLNFMFNR